jgi:DMSO/TMAO reductase YedYZ molybdopterin-dependent catalytic subunit
MTGDASARPGIAGRGESAEATTLSGRDQDPAGDPAPPRVGPGGQRGPFSPRRWRSPVRGPWLTSVFGLALLVGIPVEFVTGLISYAAYDPRLKDNDPNPGHAALGFYLFNWATNPSWLYRVSEGIHIMLGLALVPVVLAKLWSVIPLLFAWPPLRSAAQFLERISLLMLVGGVVFEMTTGIFNIEYFNLPVSFYTGHFYGAWLFMTGFAVHVALRFGRMVRALRSRRLRTELVTGVADTRPEPLDVEGLVSRHPAPPTISRRGVLALVGGTSLMVFLLTAGETIGGVMRRFALLGTHYRSPGVGPNKFPVNRTAVAAGIKPSQVDDGWRLELVGSNRLFLSRNDLLALPQTTADLPIACTEGWSTVQRWTGVPLADLARMAGVSHAELTGLETLEDPGVIALSWSQVQSPESMLALRVNGADLSPDHGFPARVIVPSAPGTHNRKWMKRIIFTDIGGG